MSSEQIQYAALDAWVALEIYEKLKDLPIANKKVSSADAGVSFVMYANSNCSGDPSAYSAVVNQEENNDFFLRNHQFDRHANSNVISRRRCVVIQIVAIMKRNMLTTCHNARPLPNEERKCLGDFEHMTSNDSPSFLLVAEMSILRTTASIEVLSRFPLSSCSVADPRIDNTSDTTPANAESSIEDDTSSVPTTMP